MSELHGKLLLPIEEWKFALQEHLQQSFGGHFDVVDLDLPAHSESVGDVVIEFVHTVDDEE